jgi:hypothetical protein
LTNGADVTMATTDVTMATSPWQHHGNNVTMTTSPWQRHHGNNVTMATSPWQHRYSQIKEYLSTRADMSTLSPDWFVFSPAAILEKELEFESQGNFLAFSMIL